MNEKGFSWKCVNKYQVSVVTSVMNYNWVKEIEGLNERNVDSFHFVPCVRTRSLLCQSARLETANIYILLFISSFKFIWQEHADN